MSEIPTLTVSVDGMRYALVTAITNHHQVIESLVTDKLNSSNLEQMFRQEIERQLPNVVSNMVTQQLQESLRDRIAFLEQLVLQDLIEKYA